ncbi:hypothetical protein [Actinomadura napierensis]|uniref:Uncharacterized protein n=1 Tax=Actinomadura napierensis TaxID=267854 RepID=A0ABN3AIV8_9ACTN
MDVVTNRHKDAIELVLSRPHASRLLGLNTDDLTEERIPGLMLSRDDQQTHAYLLRQGISRRLVITYAGEGHDPQRLLPQQNDRLAVVIMSTGTKPSAWISADGTVTSCSGTEATAVRLPSRVPLLTRSEAQDQLLSLATRGT